MVATLSAESRWARRLCARAVPSAGWSGDPLGIDGHPDLEQDFLFVRPMLLTGPIFAESRVAVGAGAETGAELLTQFRDSDGLLVLEGWTNGIVDVSELTALPTRRTAVALESPVSEDVPSGNESCADLLAAHAARAYSDHVLRRFRLRIHREVPHAVNPTYEETVLQTYVQDGVDLIDVALRCVLPGGAVAGRAWMTYERPQ